MSENVKDKLPKMKGRIQILDGKTKEVLYEKDNALQPYHITALLNMLAGNAGYHPLGIRVYLMGVGLASSTIETYTVDVPSDTITYIAFFDALDFTGSIDELWLMCTGGVFSKATVAYTKPIGTAIYISWSIQVIP